MKFWQEIIYRVITWGIVAAPVIAFVDDIWKRVIIYICVITFGYSRVQLAEMLKK